MSSVAWDLHYDRRVTPAFLANFRSGGVAHSLVEYAKHAPFPTDLQMRRNPTTGSQHATLYVGLTSVLDVKDHRKGLVLHGHKSAVGGLYGFDSAWNHPASAEELAGRWRAVEDYLELIIPIATKEHASREGAVQAAASVFTSHERAMIDREVAMHFKDNATKKGIFAELTAPFVAAVANVTGVPGKPPTSFGGECDLLALSSRGQLLAVEVKPRGTGTIVWSCAQATVYARLLERWLAAPHKRHGLDAPATIVQGMLDQRDQLGLAAPSSLRLKNSATVIPVVAIQRGAKQVYLDRMNQVQDALLAHGCGDATLEIYEVSMAGRLDRLR